MTGIEMRQLFEYELHRKIAYKAKNTQKEIPLLMNTFKYFDLQETGKINKQNWIKVFENLGIYGFTNTDLDILFNLYDVKKTGLINYKNFTDSLYGLAEPFDIPDEFQYDSNENNNIIKQPAQVEDTNNDYANNSLINPEMIINFNKKENFDDPKYNFTIKSNVKNYFNLIVNNFKSKINTLNGLTYYTFLDKLLQKQKNYRIDQTSLLNIFLNMNINIELKQQKNFFSILDLSDTGTISLFELLKLFKGTIKQNRKLLIENIFNSLDKENKGYCTIQDIINNYDPSNHPELKNGYYKNPEEIKNIFIYNFNVYCSFKNLNCNINKYNFVEFYEPISESILNDNYFNDILMSTWPIFINNIQTVQKSNIKKSNKGKSSTSNILSNTNDDMPPIINNSLYHSKEIMFDTIQKVKNYFINNGVIVFFKFIHMLRNFDIEKNHIIKYENFKKVCNIFNFNLNINEINSLFLDSKSTNYYYLLKSICGELNDYRKYFVFSLFRLIDSFDRGFIECNKFISLFSVNNHPDVINGIKNSKKVYDEFEECLCIFLDFKGKNNEQILSVEEFVDFFSFITINIVEDSQFELYMNNCWNIKIKK